LDGRGHWKNAGGPDRCSGRSPQPNRTRCNSRPEVARFFKELAGDGEITVFEPREFIEADDRGVVLGFVRVTLSATGKTFESEWAHVFTVKDGLVTRWVEFFDTAARVAA
jgi:uncharacterized protein